MERSFPQALILVEPVVGVMPIKVSQQWTDDTALRGAPSIRSDLTRPARAVYFHDRLQQNRHRSLSLGSARDPGLVERAPPGS